MLKFVLFLGNSTYTIDETQAQQVRAALRDARPLVQLDLDLFGEGKMSRVDLATRHIVAVAEYPIGTNSISENVAANVHFLNV